MNIKYKSYLSTIIIFTILSLILAGCGNTDSPSESNQEDDQQKEVTINSEMGEVTIPSEVNKVLAPFHEDALLALGVTPVAKWAIGESVQNHLEADLADIPKIEWTLPLEQVLSYEPDLIILEKNLDSYEGTYEDYKKIATTYVMDEETTSDWRKQIEVFGKLLGKEDQANKALADYEEKVASAGKQLKEAIGDETVAAMWVIGGKFFLFEKDRHSAQVLYSELGLKAPKLVEELGEGATQWQAVSLEKLSELDADHVFLLAAEGEEGIETLNNSEVWKSTTAVQKGHVYLLHEPDSWTNKGLVASEKTIDTVLNTLVK